MRKGHVAAVLGGLVVGVGLAEGGARLLSPNPGEDLLFNSPITAPQGLYRFSPTLLTEPVPGFDGEQAAIGYRVRIRINSHGLRGPEPGAGRRWLAIGDSFTMGVQVPEEDTFEARLGERFGVEVLNAGVDGYSTWQETIRYRALDALGPDTVVAVFFLGNDISDNERVPHQLRAPQAPGAGGHAPPELSTDPVTRFVFSHSVLFAYGRVAWKRHQMQSGTDFDGRRFKEELQIYSRAGRPRLEHLMRSTEQALQELRDEAHTRGDRLFVAVAPPSFAVSAPDATKLLDLFGITDPDTDAPRTAVLATLARLGIPSCDLTPPLAASMARGEKPYFRFDGHWTKRGHEVVAEALGGCVK